MKITEDEYNKLTYREQEQYLYRCDQCCTKFNPFYAIERCCLVFCCDSCYSEYSGVDDNEKI